MEMAVSLTFVFGKIVIIKNNDYVENMKFTKFNGNFCCHVKFK